MRGDRCGRARRPECRGSPRRPHAAAATRHRSDTRSRERSSRCADRWRAARRRRGCARRPPPTHCCRSQAAPDAPRDPNHRTRCARRRSFVSPRRRRRLRRNARRKADRPNRNSAGPLGATPHRGRRCRATNRRARAMRRSRLQANPSASSVPDDRAGYETRPARAASPRRR